MFRLFLLIQLSAASGFVGLANDSTIARPEQSAHGTVVDATFVSEILRDNRIGLDPARHGKVYLPPSYAISTRRYPVVYFCHNFFWSPGQTFADGNMQRLLETGFAAGTVPEFIMVVADYTSPTTGSFYENSPTSGRWLDYTVDEVVPFIDRTYRTIPHRDSRAVVGDFFGGRGALILAMKHADVFGSSYALHPVAVGGGDLPMEALGIDWHNIHAANSFADIRPGGRERIFLTISQGFLPNPDRPPFYCDWPVELRNGEPALAPENLRRLQRGFHLEEQLEAAADSLRSLRGLALDWGRFDPTQAHVVSSRRFSRMLTDLGIPHAAEEYAGGPGDQTWTEDGRFATRVLPFLARHLAGSEP